MRISRLQNVLGFSTAVSATAVLIQSVRGEKKLQTADFRSRGNAALTPEAGLIKIADHHVVNVPPSQPPPIPAQKIRLDQDRRATYDATGFNSDG